MGTRCVLLFCGWLLLLAFVSAAGFRGVGVGGLRERISSSLPVRAIASSTPSNIRPCSHIIRSFLPVCVSACTAFTRSRAEREVHGGQARCKAQSSHTLASPLLSFSAHSAFSSLRLLPRGTHVPMCICRFNSKRINTVGRITAPPESGRGHRDDPDTGPFLPRR